jgi:O-antigen/teichoic acid export membrane protein
MTDQSVSTRSQMYWSTLLKIPTQAAALVLSLIVARILMPGDYGVMGVAMMLIGFANLFTDFGFSSAIVQKQIKDEDTLRSIFTFNLAVSTALAVLFSLSARFIAEFFKSADCENVVIVMSSFFVITSFSAVPRAILRRDLDFKTLSLVDTGGAILMGVVTLLLALAHYRYWALALGQLLPTVVTTLYVCVHVRWMPVIAYKHSSMKHIVDFGFWNVLKTQLEFALGQIDKMFLGRYAGLVALGYYDKAMSIAAVPTESFIASLNAVLFSSFSQRRDDRRELRDLLKRGLMMISVLSFPVYTGLFVVAKYFVVGLLGTKWSPMILPFQIIAVSFSVKSLGGLLVAVNVAMGRYRANTLRYFLAGSVFVALCALLVGHGTSGIAVAFLVFSVLYVGLGLHLAIGALGLSWSEILGVCWPAAKATAGMLVVTGLLSWGLPSPTLVNLLVISAAGALAYASCLAMETNAAFVSLRRLAIADVASMLKRNQ